MDLPNVIPINGGDDGGPLFAEPGAMPDDIVAALVRRSRQHQSDKRKTAQAVRERILKSKHRGDIEAYVRGLYSREYAKKVCKHISVVANPFEDIVGEVVQLYKGGAIRRIDGITEDEQAAFDLLVAETGVDALAQGWSEMAYGVGPQFIVPSVRRNKMRLLSPPPTSVDVVLDVEDPTSDPVAIAYPSGKGSVVVVDGASTRVYDLTPSGAAVEDVDLRVEHGIGDLPASVLRFTAAPEASDWWDAECHARLEDGAISVGHILAKLGGVRKAQHGKLLTVTGATDDIARGQPLGDADSALIARQGGEAVDDPRRTEIDVHDLDTDPRNHLTHLRAVVEWMAESTGVRVKVQTDGSGQKFDYDWDHSQLAELRTSLLWFAHVFERQLWTFTVATAIRLRHPLAARLPKPEQVASGYFLSLPPLHRKFSDPLQEQAHWDWLVSTGLASLIDVARRFLGHRSDKALAAQLKRNLEINGQWYDEVARRNLPGDLKVQTAAQAQGAMGPAVRDGRSSPPGGEDEDDNEA